ncbi:unnamed protein product [Symbiodinium natans]|uniref:Uncharacterized protein n=1 Tax=Symbiodinium natans TaxID=878477 RepID=A0A812RZ75_9DINO|nr:unnamed protein product [Symbiodinium natans]
MLCMCRTAVLALATLCQPVLSSTFPYHSDTAFVFQGDDGQGYDLHAPLIHPCDHVPKHTCRGHSSHSSHKSASPPSTPLNCSLCPEGSEGSEGSGRKVMMYAVARLDGVGERVMQMVMYMAFATFHNFSFGGFLYNEPYDTEHVTHGMTAADMHDLTTEFMGSNVSALRLRARNPHFDHCWRGGLERQKPQLAGGEMVLVNDNCARPGERRDLFLLSQPFLKRLRLSTTLLGRPTKYFEPGQLRIAIHLRRGDIRKTTTDWWPGPDRLVPDALYVGFLSLLRRLLKPAEIHIFSTSSSSFPSTSFNRYRQPGVHVHLDGDILDDWAHMAQADVLVVAPSGFSWVAGILNSKCVVSFEAFPWGDLPHWIQLNNDFRQADKIQSCLRKQGLLQLPK